MHLALLSGAATTVLAAVVVTLLLCGKSKPDTAQAETETDGPANVPTGGTGRGSAKATAWPPAEHLRHVHVVRRQTTIRLRRRTGKEGTRHDLAAHPDGTHTRPAPRPRVP
ncbi:hypothetical protein ACOT81_36515 [Streptomyces sp. WI04-05B]|uniref:hypothetical protein n=1 Tax=Streptomyces TaxID=1883 RepID=UPI0029BA4E25|nr:MULTISPECIES: hypothetical protein [unclassified Streptomyces]MDX2546291.1 hypothetical protein [Streptomyces sp. WI04-05B]MDX2589256.1 hypothetical protein [Streptomyces sp. WI04-05A]